MNELTKDIVDALVAVGGRMITTTKISRKSEWKLLFDFYNRNNDTPLCLDCNPCYSTVFKFAEGKMKQNEVELKAHEFRSQNIV